MTQESQPYNLSTLRELLIQAYTTDELRALVSYDDRLRGLVREFAPTDSIAVLADKAIAWCDRRGVIGYLVERVKEERPDKVKGFEPTLRHADPPPSSQDTLAEQAEREAEARAARLEAERLEREKQEREAAERCQADQARAEQVDGFMAQGMGNLEEGEWRQAILFFRQVLALAPDHAGALARITEAESQEQLASRFDAGQEHLKAGRRAEAISSFRAVLEIEPAHREATKLLAEAQAQDRIQQEAEAREAEQAPMEAEERAQVPAGGRVAKAWLILGVVLLFSIAAPLHQFGGLAIMPNLVDELGLSEINSGLSLLVYVISGLVFALPAGLIYHKAGARVTGVLAGGLILLGFTLGAVGQGMTALLASCVVGGAGVIFIWVLAPAIIAQWFPARQRGTALGIWVAGMSVGSAVMMVLAQPALNTAAGWRSVWWFGAGYALVVTVLYVAFAKPAPAAGSGAESEVATAASVAPARVLRNRNIWLLAAAIAAVAATALSMGSHMSILQPQDYLEPAQVTTLATVIALLAIFSAPAGGALSDRIGSRKKLYLVGLAATVVLLSLIAVLSVGRLTVLIVLGIVPSLVGYAVLPTIFAAAVESAGDERLAGVAMAVIVLGRNAGLLLGPFVFGALVGAGALPAAFVSLVGMSALGLLAGWRAKVC